jgi:hypothetical protein
MKHVLSLRDPSVVSLRRSHPAFAGTRLLKRGSFCGVFSQPQSDCVLKLTTDSSHVGYLTDWCAPKGDYKPRVLTDHGQVGETSLRALPLYLLEVERLKPLQAGSASSKLARRLSRFTRACRNFPEDLQALSDLSPPLLEFIAQLSWFIDNYDCKLDAHAQNFMERDDGTLVFSDPVFDHKLHARFQQNRWH